MGRAHAHPGSVLSVDTIAEPIRDNYGFLVALGGTVGGLQSLTNPTGTLGRGIRSPKQNADGIGPSSTPPSQNPSIRVRLNDMENNGGIYINSGIGFVTPFEGPFYLAQ